MLQFIYSNRECFCKVYRREDYVKKMVGSSNSCGNGSWPYSLRIWIWIRKRSGGDITLVIPRKIGACQLRKVPVAELLPIIRAGLEA